MRTTNPFTKTEHYRITVETERLTDGSIVWNVDFCGFTFHAMSQSDAVAMADKITAAITDHSLETAERRGAE